MDYHSPHAQVMRYPFGITIAVNDRAVVRVEVTTATIAAYKFRPNRPNMKIHSRGVYRRIYRSI